MAKRFGLLTVLAALFALCLILTPAAALAGPSGDHDGDADSNKETALEDDHGDGPDDANAHPSGNDKSAEAGGSGNQGKSESNPDDSKGPMRNEGGLGDDKSDGPGGTDRDDQDGNNGCGNDDDFNDDNNGWCGKPTAPPGPPTTTDFPPGVLPGVEVESNPGTPEDNTVLGNRFNKPSLKFAPSPAVLGDRQGAAALPATGASSVASFVLAGFGLMSAGALFTLRRK